MDASSAWPKNQRPAQQLGLVGVNVFDHQVFGVANRITASRHGGHQQDLLSALAKERYLIWSQDVDGLPVAIERAKDYEFQRYVSPGCEIHTVIKGFLQQLSQYS